LLSERLQALGFQTKRYGDSCSFASTSKEQASDYARDDDHLFEIEPLETASVMLVVDCKDMVLKFEGWLREQAIWGPTGASVRSRFLSDVQGDIATVETYLRLGRMKKVLSGLADDFLSRFEIREIVIESDIDLKAFLNGFDGEVVINGPTRMEPVMHEALMKM
jgi:hypothetical protein